MTLYYIYTDEAGTSARETVTVVVGVVVHADRHWRAASARLNATLDRLVPQRIRPGFLFHAKDIWSGYRELDSEWTRQARCELIGAVAAIPRELRMAIVLGRVRRDFAFPLNEKVMKLHDLHHLLAFSRCMARSNKYVRDWSDPSEVATIIAEDVTDKRKQLRQMLKVEHLDLPRAEPFIVLSQAEQTAGKAFQTNSGPIDRIIDTVHFAGKEEAPLLQLADACAFSFRRYFAAQSHGEEMVQAMLGERLVWDDWQGPMSEVTFVFDPAQSYPRWR